MKQSFFHDLQSSFVVFLVALPLSLGISMASGAPVEAGLIAAAIGGIIVGMFGGCALQVSGPAAGLTVIVFGMIQKFGFEATCAIGLLAGGFQVLMGALKLGELTMMISPSVIHAMLAGIGVLISLGQMHVLLGHKPYGSAIQNIMELRHSFADINLNAALLGIITLVILIVWQKWIAKKIKFIPGSLVAVLIGTAISVVFAFDVPRVKMDAALSFHPSLSGFSHISIMDLLVASLTLTLIASAESLLCAIAADKLSKSPPSDLNRELIGQGLGNLTSGLLGGLPITGVIVRSSANISSGAKTRLSAILHGVWILVFALFFASMIEMIPVAVLAALLIQVGVNLVKIHEIKVLKEFNEHIIYFITLFGVIFINLLAGIGLGFASALFVFIKKLNQIEFKQTDSASSMIKVNIGGNLSFLCVPKLLKSLKSLPTGKTIEIEFNIDSIDHACVEAIRDWKTTYENQGGKIIKGNLVSLWAENR